MKRMKLVFLLMVLGGILLAIPAQGQMNGRDPRQELERTDRILDRARDQVGVSLSSRAGNLLNQAMTMQAQAVRLYDNRNRNTWGPTLRLTQQAQQMARRAIETAEIEAKAHESIRDLIDSTRDLAQDAAVLVRERGDDEAQRLLDGGLWQLERAQDSYRGLAYRKAIRLAVTSRDLVQRAMQRARDGNLGGESSLDTAMDRTQGLIEELRVNLEGSNDKKARRLYEQAMRTQEEAVRKQRDQRLLIARRLTTQARQSALEGLMILTEQPDEEVVERALAVVETLIQDAAPVILESGSSEATELLNSARLRHAEAREQLARGDVSRALATARIAEGLLRRAAEVAGDR